MSKIFNFLTFFLLLFFLSSCKVPTTVNIKDIRLIEAKGMLLDYIFLNGYQIVDRDDDRGLFLVYVDSQRVSEYEVISDTQQIQDSVQLDSNQIVGPPILYNPMYTHDNTTRNITQTHQQNQVRHRQIIEDKKEQFSVKITQKGPDVLIILNATSEIELNPAYYLNALISFFQKNGYTVDLESLK